MMRGAHRATSLLAACGALALLTGIATPLAAQQRPPLDTLLARAGAYVELFVKQFSNVVAEERYVQDILYTTSRDGFDASRRRELKSDFLLVKTPTSADWLLFRDVLEVDGRAVADRDQRRAKLFLESKASALAPAAVVLQESARYNLDPSRAVNNPLMALMLLQRRYQAGLEFTLRGIDRNVGPDASVVDFQEREKLNSILPGGLRAKGRFWIESETGRVLRTDLEARESDHVITSFRFDETFGVAVPVKMEERYVVPGGRGLGTATYGRFRRFEVRTEEKIQ